MILKVFYLRQLVYTVSTHTHTHLGLQIPIINLKPSLGFFGIAKCLRLANSNPNILQKWSKWLKYFIPQVLERWIPPWNYQTTIEKTAKMQWSCETSYFEAKRKMLSELQLLNGEMFQARPVVRLQVDIHKQLQHVTSLNIWEYLLITMGTQNLHF